MVDAEVEKKFREAVGRHKKETHDVAELVAKLIQQKEVLDSIVLRAVKDIRQDDKFAHVTHINNIAPVEAFEVWAKSIDNQPTVAAMIAKIQLQSIVCPAHKAQAAVDHLGQAVTELKTLLEQSDTVIENQEVEIWERYQRLADIEETYLGLLKTVAETHVAEAEKIIGSFIDAYEKQEEDVDRGILEKYDSRKNKEQRTKMMSSYWDAAFENTHENRNRPTFHTAIRIFLTLAQRALRSRMQASFTELHDINATLEAMMN